MAKNEEKLNYAAEKRALKRDGPSRLYLLHGKETYLLGRFLEDLTAVCLPEGADDFSLRELDGASLTMQELSDSVNALPFATERTLTIVRGFDLNRCKDSDMKALEHIVSDVPDYATLVFVCRGALEPDGRLKPVKMLRKYARDLNFTEQDENQLVNWIGRRFDALGKRISPSACEALIYTSGALMDTLIPEIEKIAATVPGPEIKEADIERLAFRIPETRVFDMTDAISARDFDKAAFCLADLLSMGEEPLKILGAVGYNMRRLYAARLARAERLGEDFVKRCTGVKYPFMLRKLTESASRFSLDGLRRAVELCAETDYAMKSSSAGDEELLCELLARFAVECA